MWTKFKYWFKNIFLYYYKWGVILTLIFVGMITYLMVDQYSRGKPDLYVAMLFSTQLSEQELEDMQKNLQFYMEDYNDDGKVTLRCHYIHIDNKVGDQEMMEFAALLVDDKYVMYLTDTYVLDNTELQDACSTYPVRAALGTDEVRAKVKPAVFNVKWSEIYAVFRSNTTKQSDEEFYKPCTELLGRIGE